MLPLRISFRKNAIAENERGVALLAGVMIVFFLSLMIGAALLRSQMLLKEVDQRIDSHYAFYCAEAGLDRALFELRRNSNWRPGPGEQGVSITINQGGNPVTLGTYSLSAQDGGVFQNWDTVWVRSIGYEAGGLTPRTLVARIIVANPAKFLVLTLGSLHIVSGASVDFDIFGQDIYFDVNETLPSPQKDINVNGDVYYIRSVNGDRNPAVKFGTGSSTINSPSITFAGVDLNRYRTLAQNLTSTGEGLYDPDALSVDLDSYSSTSPAPKIIFAEGDISVHGDYPNSLIIVSGGDIILDGDIGANSTETGPLRPQLGLLAQKDVTIPATTATGTDMNLEAFVMANGGSGSQGNFIAQGSPRTKGSLNFSGAIAVRGAGRTGVDMNAFQQRNYNFNSQLSANNSIPFSPFIANIVLWNEVEPTDPFPPP